MSLPQDAITLHQACQGVGCITLNHPDSRNSLSLAMLELLEQRLDEAAANNDYQVIIIAAAGHVFSAGHNLKEIQQQLGNHEAQLALFKQCSVVMQKVVNLPKPVIAQVQGVATAAGCQLVASCDLAVAADNARFATPGVNIGLFCSTPMVALTRNVQPKHAMEMLLTGRMITADKAEQIGLVNRVVAAETLEQETLDLAKLIASKSPKTLAIGKKAFYTQNTMTLADAYDYTAQVMADNLDAVDAKEGICAFVEKREPKWRGE